MADVSEIRPEQEIWINQFCQRNTQAIGEQLLKLVTNLTKKIVQVSEASDARYRCMNYTLCCDCLPKYQRLDDD